MTRKCHFRNKPALDKSLVLGHLGLETRDPAIKIIQIEILANILIKIFGKSQTTQVFVNLNAKVNYMSQMFLVRNRWTDIRPPERIWYINNKQAHCYKIVNIDYFVKNFEKSLRLK